MIISSDPTVQPASILINIEASRAHFEALIANMSNMTNASAAAPTGGEGGSVTDGAGAVGVS